MDAISGKDQRFLSSGNIAFVIVVGASYLSATAAIIYSRRAIPGWEVAVLILAGAAYLVVGTYGFATCRRSGSARVSAKSAESNELSNALLH